MNETIGKESTSCTCLAKVVGKKKVQGKQTDKNETIGKEISCKRYMDVPQPPSLVLWA